MDVTVTGHCSCQTSPAFSLPFLLGSPLLLSLHVAMESLQIHLSTSMPSCHTRLGHFWSLLGVSTIVSPAAHPGTHSSLTL